MNLAAQFRGKQVLITGGLGFIGSNLAHRLATLGAKIRLVDATLPGTGSNPFNLQGLPAEVDLWRADLRDKQVVKEMIIGQDYLFNLAGLISHLDSMQFPENDLEINASCQLAIIEACRKHNPTLKIVYAGTRQVYGKARYLPVDENHPIDPVDYNGVTKRAGEMYHLVGQRVYGLHAVSLRLTNTYGPRMYCRDGRLTFLGGWLQRLFAGEPLEIYGSGEQIRDLNYVEDVVEALLLAVTNPEASGKIYNLGSGEPLRLLDLARLLIELFGAGRYELVPFPAERLRIDIGDYQANTERIQTELGWQPKIPLREGLARTLEFYRQHGEHYW